MTGFGQQELYIIGKSLEKYYSDSAIQGGLGNIPFSPREIFRLRQRVMAQMISQLGRDLPVIVQDGKEVSPDLVVGCRCIVLMSGHRLNNHRVKLQQIEVEYPDKSTVIYVDGTREIQSIVSSPDLEQPPIIRTWVVAGHLEVVEVPPESLVRES